MISSRTPSVAVLAVAMLLAWPAFYNGYPLLFPDSMSYLGDSGRVARALLFRDFSEYYGGRSFIYGLGILPFHWNITAWPIVALHAVLTAYVLWLVVRSLIPEGPLTAYLVSAVLLSLLTGMPWFVGFIMPDILGPVLYLSIYLIAYWWDALSRPERIAIAFTAWWSAASHSTHLLLLGGLCMLMLPLLIVQGYPSSHWIRAIGRILIIALGAAAANIAIHFCLYDEPSLTGHRPPFLMARLVADGPARWYLHENCGQLDLMICDRVQDLPDNVANFLWAPDAIWRTASLPEQQRLQREEMLVVVGTIRTYPWTVLSIAVGHSWRQLTSFGLWTFDPDPWILETMNDALPNARSSYVVSRQAQGLLNEGFFTLVQNWTVIVSLVLIAVCLLFLRKTLSRQLVGFTVVIAFVVISNAAVTGVLSNVEDRYQCRVVWLVPLLASMLLLRSAIGQCLLRQKASEQP